MAFRKNQKRVSGEDPELGAIFMSNGATKAMCFKSKTFGLPYSNKRFVERVKANMFLFLFEHETRKLYGVFQACSDGAMNFSSEAFSAAGIKYPAQVQFKVLWHCKPLLEHEFRPAIKDNYFAPKKFHFGLSRNQVKELLQLFKSRKLRDELLEEKMTTPCQPSLVRGVTRSCNVGDTLGNFVYRIPNENGLENANVQELNKNLEKFSIPNSEVHGRLMIVCDRDVRHEDVDTVLPLNKYRREAPSEDMVTPLRDPMNYCCNSNNDYALTSEAHDIFTEERYDPDKPSFENLPGTLQFQRFHEVQNFAGQGHVNLGIRQDTCDWSLYPVSHYCSSVPVIGNEVAFNDLRMSSATNEAIISNLRSPHPAYFDNAVNGRPSSYNPAYFENISLLSKPDDPSQTISHPLSSEHFKIGTGIQSFGTKHQEDVLPHSSACGISHELETTFPSVGTKDIGNPVDIKRDSKVCKERKSVFSRLKPALDADDESKLKDPLQSIDQMFNEVVELLKGHDSQLVRESNSAPTKQVDGSDDKRKIKLKKQQCFQSRIANFDEDQSEEQVIGEVRRIQFKRRSEVQKTRNSAGSGLGESSSPILAEKQCKRRKLVRPSFTVKQLSKSDLPLDSIAVNLSPSCSKDVSLRRDNKRDLPETGNLESGVLLAAGIGGECSDRQSGSSNLTDGNADIGMGTELENHEGQSLSNPLAFDTQELPKLCNLSSAVLVDDSLGGVKRSEESTLVREKESVGLSLTLSGNYEKDANVECDNVKEKDVLKEDRLGWSLKIPNLPVDHCSNMNVGMKCEGLSTKMELGGSHNDLDMNTNDGMEDSTVGRVEEAMPFDLLADGTSVSGQATKVRYFEFLTR